MNFWQFAHLNNFTAVCIVLLFAVAVHAIADAIKTGIIAGLGIRRSS